jgi:steroid 5-alpha reductase family enzyme
VNHTFLETLELVWPLLAYGSVILMVLFTLTWLLQLKTKNAGIVDTVWAISFPILAAMYCILADGLSARKIMMLAIVGIAGLRLAYYLVFRTIGHPEDARYKALREEWGIRQNGMMLRFYYFQAVLALILSIPFALIAVNTAPEIHWIEIAGLILAAVAMIGEAISDEQLKKFKQQRSNHGKVMDAGLWRYSRHPNYFFQWGMWVAYLIMALHSPWGWLSILSPALMLYFLLYVTGILYTETHMVKSRGKAYEDYQKSTSAFVPLPKKYLTTLNE